MKIYALETYMKKKKKKFHHTKKKSVLNCKTAEEVKIKNVK